MSETGIEPNDLDVQSLIESIQRSLNDVSSNKARERRRFSEAPKASIRGLGIDIVDADFVASLATTELFQEQDLVVFDSILWGGVSDMVAIDREVGRDFYSAYSQLAFSQHYGSTNILAAFSDASRRLVQHPDLYQATRTVIAPISFGKPIVYRAQEKKLRIPNAISQSYDVYWIEFAISLRNLEGEDFEQATFHVMVPDDSLALELIPLSYGVERTVTEKSSTPPIGVSRGRVDIKVGEVFSHTVAYTTLKPTIVANGLQESQFSWSLKGEAVNTGSKRFVAIVGVPKGATSLVAQLALAAKTADSWGIQGDLASTGVIIHKIEL